MEYEEALEIVNKNNLWQEVREHSQNQGNAVVISRDDTMLQYAKDNGIQGDYSQVWKALEEDNGIGHKAVDKIEQETFKQAVKDKRDIIVDRTNMSRKSRRKWLNAVPKDYNKKAVVFATAYDEVYYRNKERFEETGKGIENWIIGNMMKQFMVPMYDEVDTIEWVF